MYAADDLGLSDAAKAAKEAAYVDSTKIKPYSDKTDKEDTQNELNESYQKADSTNIYIDETPKGDYLSLHSPKKHKPDSSTSLTGQDLFLPAKAKKQLLNYKEEYSKAEAELNYMEMNKIHKESAELRQKYYDFVDDYDYSHGGLYDIYTNYSDSYDENGHYEHVFKMDANSLNLFYERSGNKYFESITGVPSSNEEFIADAVVNSEEIIDLFSPIAAGIANVIIKGAKIMFNNLMINEKKSFKNSNHYIEQVMNKYASNDLDFYVYLLDGGYSTEIQLRAVDKKTGQTLSQGVFDLRQYNSYSGYFSAAEKYGELVAVNRRLWNYSYVN